MHNLKFCILYITYLLFFLDLQKIKTYKPDIRVPVPQISVNCLRVSSQPPMQPDLYYETHCYKLTYA